MQQLNAFLTDIFPDITVREYVLSALAHTLYSPTPFQRFFILKGDGANGKSTFLRFLNYVFSDKYDRGTSFILSHPDYLSVLPLIKPDTQFLEISELEQGECIQALNVKSILSGEHVVVSVDDNNDDRIYKFTGSIFLPVNDFPPIDSPDQGTMRRLVVIPFTNTFKPNNLSSLYLPSLFQKWKQSFLQLLQTKYAENEGDYPVLPTRIRKETESYYTLSR